MWVKKKTSFALSIAFLSLYLISPSRACSAVSEENQDGDPEVEEEEEDIAPRPRGPIVSLPLPYGFLEGTFKKTVGYSGRDKKDYEVYRSIPYSLPINGNTRFAQSEPLPDDYPPLGTSNSPFDASKTGPLCPQGEMNPDKITDFMSMSISEVLDQAMGAFTERTRGPFPTSHRDTINILEKLFNIEALHIRNKTLGETIKAWMDVDFAMSEDCLHLTISKPKKEAPPGGFPVMFFVHGGGFSSGTHLHSEADHLGDVEDVVIVAINYRVGILGFLCLDSDESAGNQGMLDIVLALEWVQKYIEFFGGDKDRVTIFGESAGSATIGHLLLSPLTKDLGLFKYGIGQSGSAISPWAFDTKPRESAYEFANRMGCDINHGDDAIVECLRRFQAWELTREFNRLTNDRRKGMDLGFGGTSPCAQSKGKREFYGINNNPQELLYKGEYNKDIPILFGANLDEGIYALNLVYNTFIKPNKYHKGTKRAKDYLKYQFLDEINTAVSFDSGYTLKNIVEDNYFGKATDMSSLKKITPGLVDYFGMHILKASTYEMMSKHVDNQGTAYWYSFEYAGQKSLCHILAMLAEAPNVGPYGACHGDELLFMFDYEFPLVLCDLQKLITDATGYLAYCAWDLDCLVEKLRENEAECLEGYLTEKEKGVSEILAKIWTNFAKTGNPNGDGIPEFKPWNRDTEEYIVIDSTPSVDHKYEKNYVRSRK